MFGYASIRFFLFSELSIVFLLKKKGSLFAMYEHSGYFFTSIKAFDSRMHLSHHFGRLNGSFSEGVGSPGYMDKIFNTDLKDENGLMANLKELEEKSKPKRQ